MIRWRSAALVLGVTGGLVALPAGAGAVEVQRVVSPLGIEAWLVETDAVPVIAMEFAFEGGLLTDAEGKEGRANLVSTLLDEGAGPLDSETFQRRLADAAISLDFTAGTDAFYGSLKTVASYSDEAFDLLELALTEPRFDAEAVERMRAAIAAEIRRNVADPEWMARRAYYDAAFPNHPFGRPSRGTLDTLAELTADDLRRFVGERFARDNLTIGVAGNISAEALAPVLDAVFGSLPANAASVAVPPASPQAAGETILVERAGPQSVLMLAQEGIAREDPDYYAAYIMNHVLAGGGFEGRLTEEVRSKRGLTYGIGGGLLTTEYANLLTVSSTLSNENVEPALTIIAQEWQRMRDGGVTAEELENAKTYLTGSFALGFTSTDRVASVLLGMQLDQLGIDFIDRYDDYIEAVTLDDVNRVAADLLTPDALTAVVVGEPAGDLSPDRTIEGAALAARELGQGS